MFALGVLLFDATRFPCPKDGFSVWESRADVLALWADSPRAQPLIGLIAVWSCAC